MAALTDRERTVARLTADGYTTAAVAIALSVSVRTVENDLYALFAKLGVASRAEFLDLADDLSS